MTWNRLPNISTGSCCSTSGSLVLARRRTCSDQKNWRLHTAGGYGWWKPRGEWWPWATPAVRGVTSMTTLLDWLVQPFTYAFMQRGLVAAVLVGALCAVVGTYVVLRGMAFFGDALAHTILHERIGE